MGLGKYLTNGLIGAFALILAGARLIPGTDSHPPRLLGVATLMAGTRSGIPVNETPVSALLARSSAAVRALAAAVRPLSHPKALETAFRSYFAYLAAHPGEVKKPVLYFVDYGLPSTEPRGYVFDMQALKILEGPFAVAHGRGSSRTQYGVPTRFSNAPGSAATSLGLYLAENTYDFHGHTGGRSYSSIGLRLRGVSESFNDNALARGVVAHGAPYVTADRAGRSEGCPAMEQDRAQRVLPELADGGMVFLFAPDQRWMAYDPWVGASTN
ncbi:MAG: murein L,D-transpeptidase catalytic domain family protein [Gemmatimonadota bacterium]|nr:murein L,D-transpeptidase catalytic domain family protein [Gemmatimonadota bacterium]